jgi:hypothetical protein
LPLPIFYSPRPEASGKGYIYNNKNKKGWGAQAKVIKKIRAGAMEKNKWQLAQLAQKMLNFYGFYIIFYFKLRFLLFKLCTQISRLNGFALASDLSNGQHKKLKNTKERTNLIFVAYVAGALLIFIIINIIIKNGPIKLFREKLNKNWALPVNGQRFYLHTPESAKLTAPLLELEKENNYIEQFFVGLLEGDGTITTNISSNKTIRVRVVIALKNENNNHIMLNKIQKIIGGRVVIERKNKYVT